MRSVEGQIRATWRVPSAQSWKRGRWAPRRSTVEVDRLGGPVPSSPAPPLPLPSPRLVVTGQGAPREHQTLSYNRFLRALTWTANCLFTRAGGKQHLLFLLFVWGFFWPRSMGDLRSLTRDRMHAPCSGRVESEPPDCQGSPSHSF